MIKKISQKEFESIYSKVPCFCIDLIITNRKELLLTKRTIPPFKGSWHLPGGVVLYKERIDAAILRIAKEELGIRVKPQKLVGYLENLKSGIYRHDIALGFKCKIIGNKEPRAVTQANSCVFFKKLPPKVVKKQAEFLKKNWNRIIKWKM